MHISHPAKVGSGCFLGWNQRPSRWMGGAMLHPPCAEAQRCHSFLNHCVVKTSPHRSLPNFYLCFVYIGGCSWFISDVTSFAGIDISVTFLSFLANVGYLGCHLWTRDFAPVSVVVSLACLCRLYLETRTLRVQDVGVGNVPVI